MRNVEKVSLMINEGEKFNYFFKSKCLNDKNENLLMQNIMLNLLANVINK